MTRVEKREMKQAERTFPCAVCRSSVSLDGMLTFNRGRETYHLEWRHIDALLLDPAIQKRIVTMWPEMRPGLVALMPAWFNPPVARAEVDMAPLMGVVDNLRGALVALRDEVNAVVAGQRQMGETLNSDLHVREARGREAAELLSVIRGEMGELASHLKGSPASPPPSPAVDFSPIVARLDAGFRSLDEIMSQRMVKFDIDAIAAPVTTAPIVDIPAASPRRGRPPGRAPPAAAGNGEEAPPVTVVKKGGKEVSVKQRMREAILALEEVGERATAEAVAEAAGIRVELVGKLAKMFPGDFKLRGEVYTVAGK